MLTQILSAQARERRKFLNHNSNMDKYPYCNIELWHIYHNPSLSGVV